MGNFGLDLVKLIFGFGFGFICGYVTRGIRDKSKSSIDNEKIISLLITFIYIFSIIADIFVPSYDTPIALHGIMGGIVGFYYKKKKI